MNPEKDETDTQELDGDLAIDDETAEQVTGGLARTRRPETKRPETKRPELRRL